MRKSEPKPWESALRSPILILFTAACSLLGQDAGAPAKLARADCFFGIHFDFHAREDCDRIGENVSPGDIESFINQVNPDFIEVDCKGHPGYSSYPTKVGNPAPGFVSDPLRIWRDVTNKHGVALYVHYSGVWDFYVCRHHPEWAAVGASGERSSKATSVFSPYVDRVLIPQLEELNDVYHVDGAWIDGDCWGAEVDYGNAAKLAYAKATGGKIPPDSPAASGYGDYLEFNRSAFKAYVRHYVDAIHRRNPAFQITSNWSFSSVMPEQVSANVDFLSGDLSPQNAVNSAAFEARCMALQGKPWDLMSWAFTMDLAGPAVMSYKSSVQLEQEAAEVMAVGGAYQAYFPQYRDASMKVWNIPVMKRLSDFCKLRKSYCHGAVPVPQIGLLHSSYGYKAISHTVYGYRERLNEPSQGILTALLDGQNCVEIVREYSLKNDPSRYPLIVIPEWEYLDKGFCDQLIAYVAKGGNLLVIGAKAVSNFKQVLGVDFADGCQAGKFDLVDGLNHSGLVSNFQPVVPKAGTERFGSIIAPLNHATPAVEGRLKRAIRYSKDSNQSFDFPSATMARVGQGRIAGVYVDLGGNYGEIETSGIRDFINSLVHRLFPDPLLAVEGSHLVHVAANRLNGRLMVHLINTAGNHENRRVYSYDEVPAINGLTISISLPSKPGRIVAEPEGTDIDFVYHEGKATLRLPSLGIHEILEVRE